MGRGASQNGSTAILYGHTGQRSNGLDEIGSISLSTKQEVALLALRELVQRLPSAPGFEAYDIAEAAEPIERLRQEWIPLNATGTVLHFLRKKGLVERSNGCFKGAGGIVVDSERGWALTERGVALAASLEVSAS